jgi:hypothetical protein
LIILAVPLDGSWIRTFGEEPNQTATVYGLMFPSQILGYISAVIRGWSVFKDVFSSLIIPLITAYSVKSIGTEEVSYKVRLFLTYLVILLMLRTLSPKTLIFRCQLMAETIKISFSCVTSVILLFLSMIGNAMVSAVDLSSISTELNKYDDGTTVPILTLEEINLTKDTITDLQETTSNYVKDCLTYIALTIGITYKNNSKTQ